MKRMIDNKEFDALKKDVKDINDEIETHATDYIITSVVNQDEEVEGFIIKDVENEITYNLVLGNQVEANPTLEGTESDLEGIEIDGTKYKIGGGKQLYQHNIKFATSGGGYPCMAFPIINDSPTPFTDSTLASWLYTRGYSNYETKFWGASGKAYDSGYKHIIGITGNQYGQLNAPFAEGTSFSVNSITDDVETL